MGLRNINEGFKRLYESTINEASAPINELRLNLEMALDTLAIRQEANIKAYEIAFQDVIEKFYPDKAWWEVCDLDIFSHLFTERDPSATINAIMDNIKEPVNNSDDSSIEESSTSYQHGGELIVNNNKDGNWFVKGHPGTFATDTEAEEYVDSMNEDFDKFYGSLFSEMDQDNEKLYNLYQEGNMSPCDALVSMGYQEVDDHYLIKEIEKDGSKYKQVFDFSKFDFGDEYYSYYVVKDGVLLPGFTVTKSKVD